MFIAWDPKLRLKVRIVCARAYHASSCTTCERPLCPLLACAGMCAGVCARVCPAVCAWVCACKCVLGCVFECLLGCVSVAWFGVRRCISADEEELASFGSPTSWCTTRATSPQTRLART